MSDVERFDRDDAADDLQALAYAVSHDLGEPLRAITGFAQLLEQSARSKLSDDERDYLDFILDGAERMRALLDGLLAYSRVVTRASSVERVDLGAVLEEVVHDARPGLEDLDVRLEIGDLPVVMADRNQLQQLLAELLTNAVRFRRTDRTPVIRFESTPLEEGEQISVIDNGIGISPHDRTKVFGMFARLQRRDEYAGYGVGLAVVARIVERHGGRVWVDDGIDGGTALHFTVLSPKIHIAEGAA